MPKPQINISINRKLNISINKSWIRSIILETLESGGIEVPVEMGLVITDNEVIQELNRTYRNEDKPTDVLSFHMPFDRGQEPGIPFVSPPDGVKHLGEVVISYPKAVHQAQEHGHSITQELALLLVHGVLHLLGYDHERTSEERRMRAREKKIMQKLYAAWIDK